MLFLSYDMEVGRLRWFDGQGDSPRTSRAISGGALGTVEAVLAHTIESRRGIRHGAGALASAAWLNLRAHRDTGAAHIEIKGSPPNALDHEVILADADSASGNRTRKRSALSIEFGHLQKGGERVGGLYILTGAANRLARKPGRRF